MEVCTHKTDVNFTKLKISTSTDFKESIKSIFDFQEQRVHVWNEFDLLFKEYTLDAPYFDLKKLQLICKDIGDELNSISSKIILIKEAFSQNRAITKDLHKLIEKLQENEQIKFKLV